MPTATVELCRSTPAYVAVAFVARPEYVRVKPAGRDAVREVLPPLPPGLCDFGSPGRARGPLHVVIELPADASGTDYTPALVAADYLREQGWEVELPSWIQRGWDVRVPGYMQPKG